MSTTSAKSCRRLLYNGGELFVNRMGSTWYVDVFSLGSEPGDDPVYHASYPTFAEAMADADLWVPWPEDGLDPAGY